jgi:uncharacterized integral membrane protein (TIGR00697 family)
VALTPLILFGPIVAAFAPAPGGEAMGGALDVVFGLAPRIAIASLITYVVAQHVDIHLYEAIHARAPSARWLWLRNNGSTFVSQFVDQTLFVTLAFAGALPIGALLQLFVAGYVIKVVVALCDTPFVYLAHLLVRRRTPEGSPQGRAVEAPAD